MKNLTFIVHLFEYFRNEYAYFASRKTSWPYEDSDDELSEPLVTRVESDQEIAAKAPDSDDDKPTSSSDCLKRYVTKCDSELNWVDNLILFFCVTFFDMGSILIKNGGFF